MFTSLKSVMEQQPTSSKSISKAPRKSIPKKAAIKLPRSKAVNVTEKRQAGKSKPAYIPVVTDVSSDDEYFLDQAKKMIADMEKKSNEAINSQPEEKQPTDEAGPSAFATMIKAVVEANLDMESKNEGMKEGEMINIIMFK